VLVITVVRRSWTVRIAAPYKSSIALYQRLRFSLLADIVRLINSHIIIIIIIIVLYCTLYVFVLIIFAWYREHLKVKVKVASLDLYSAPSRKAHL